MIKLAQFANKNSLAGGSTRKLVVLGAGAKITELE